MTAESNRLTFTEIEIRGFLPSGWEIRTRGAGIWNSAKRVFEIEVYDPADNPWPLLVTGKDATASGRLEALRQSIASLCRNAVH